MLIQTEQPILRGAPDAISASALRDLGSNRIRQSPLRNLSTRYRGAGHFLRPVALQCELFRADPTADFGVGAVPMTSVDK
ncbi:MAG: hypothetical protein DLM63_03895 [Solirubrobacterales bacterium]|nr:MAG: hypothetical protein DLM63_03895 [Solirubrobacterales bacterium]